MHFIAKPPVQASSVLMLADGSVFYGQALGYKATITGEICFNTSVTGYQEVITDPSYANQIINFTFPHIGNVGTNIDDNESQQVYAAGVVLSSAITNASNFRSTENLDVWLKQHKITGIYGIDTRAVTRQIRKIGTQNALISNIYPHEELNLALLYKILHNAPPVQGLDIAGQVTCPTVYNWHQGLWDEDAQVVKQYKVVVIDYGVKRNILRSLYQLGCEVTVVPANTEAHEILALKPEGIVLSNGPGDPAETGIYAVPIIKELIAAGLPLFGICLGHQLLALALGAKTVKMPQGHRGANHPVKNLATGRVEITSQNHGFVVEHNSLPNNVEVTHISLFDQTIEGIAIIDKPIFAVQYHPENAPGPHDSHYLFAQFIDNIKNSKI
jgi:carbamoyl-phosphate synthase small subunit